MTVDVDALQRHLDFLSRQLDATKKENVLLKQTMRAALPFTPIRVPDTIQLDFADEDSPSWAEKSEHFEMLVRKVAEVCIRLNQATMLPQHYDSIIHAFQVQYPKLYREIDSPGETLSRRARQAREAGLLISPTPGYFWIGPKALAQTTPAAT